EPLAIGLVEDVANELPEGGVHAKLVPECHNANDLTVLELRKPLEQMLEEALLEGVLLLLVDGGAERLLHVWIQQMRQLSVISNEENPTLCQRHRNEKVKRIGSGRLVHNYILELEIEVLAALRDDEVVADRLLAGRRVDGCIVLQQLSHAMGILSKRLRV